MKIAFYSHTIDFAGTWRSHERLAEILQHKPGISIDVLYSPAVDNNRLEESKRILHRCDFIPFERSLQKTGPEFGYTPLTSNISEVVATRNIDVFHFARSGYYEWPFNKRMCNVQVETNIFGYSDHSTFLDGSISIARCLGIPESRQVALIPNPITPPSPEYETLQDLRSELGITKDEIVFGRIGRPANFTPISLTAFSAFRNSIPSKYVIIGGCEEAKTYVKANGMQDDVIFLDCTNDDNYIERFHKTIDVFAHYRSDGEICSTAIAQAMMYGRPVITHYAGRNGQAEWLGNGGACVSNPSEYLRIMHLMSQHNALRHFSEAAKKFAQMNFDQKTIADKVLGFYERIVRDKNCAS